MMGAIFAKQDGKSSPDSKRHRASRKADTSCECEAKQGTEAEANDQGAKSKAAVARDHSEGNRSPDGRRLGIRPPEAVVGSAGTASASSDSDSDSDPAGDPPMQIEMFVTKEQRCIRKALAPFEGSRGLGAIGPPRRLSREVRGLREGSDKENQPPSIGVIGDRGSAGTLVTRSKTRRALAERREEQLLQEHPSVNLRRSSGRATQQAASPPSALTSKASAPAAVRYINGIKMTVVDEDSKIFVLDLVSPKVCDKIRSMTDSYVRSVHESGSRKETWRTLYTYTKMDLPCNEVPGLMEDVIDGVMADLIGIVGKVYAQPKEAAKLKPRSWKEPHLLHYQKVKGKPEHKGIEMHYDGCDITWQLMLSGKDEYEGGGTYVRCLRKTVMLQQGQVLCHPGEIYHRGNDITEGTRSLVICFLDGFCPGIVDSSSASEDHPEYWTAKPCYYG